MVKIENNEITVNVTMDDSLQDDNKVWLKEEMIEIDRVKEEFIVNGDLIYQPAEVQDYVKECLKRLGMME